MKIHDSGTAEASGGPQVAAFGRARRGGLSHFFGGVPQMEVAPMYPNSWMVRENPQSINWMMLKGVFPHDLSETPLKKGAPVLGWSIHVNILSE